MGRLRQLPARVSAVAPRVQSHGSGADRLARRDATVAWRRWYKTAAWRRLRWQVLAEALFTCARCGACYASDTAQLVCDHKTPHRGDEALFWDRANLDCLCKPCHDGAKQAAERSTLPRLP